MTDLELIPSTIGKLCIFCGAAPSNKNKEHVIPRWLIEITGDPKRTWHLGVKFAEDGQPPRKFSADQFQFPACEECNTDYSSLEGRTKTNMVRLLGGHALSAHEWDDLLDWFDKVRIGLWLGMLALNKDTPIPRPKFHIDQRVGKKDRAILVYPMENDHQGLTMVGTGDPVFFFAPICFGLVINNLLFVNLSSDFLLSARMGFPFAAGLVDDQDRTMVSHFDTLYRMKTPFIRFSFYVPIIEVYQTILAEHLFEYDSYKQLADSDYVRSKLLPDSNIKTRLCTFIDGKPIFLEPTESVHKRALTNNQLKPFNAYSVRLFEYRSYVMDCLLKSGQVEQTRQLVQLMLKFNRGAVSLMKRQM
jgi:hypothetical protein